MTPYKVPSDNASAEFIEKKSRFTGNIFKIESAEEATEIIKATKKRLWDATHNVYAYVLKNGVMRFSDDGEPQGTAGLPTLDVLKKEEICDVLCITTRYFGGILLGAGGLTRAYSHACAIALAAAGVSLMVPHAIYNIDCPYNLLELVRKHLEGLGATERGAEFGASVMLSVCVESTAREALEGKIIDVTAGKVHGIFDCEQVFPKKLK